MNEIINTAIDLTPLFQALIALFGVIITAYLIPALKARLTNEQQEKLRNVVHIAVYAAEKIYGDGKGEQKLQYAEDYIRRNYGVKVDTKALKDMIDAEIKDMELKDFSLIVEEAAKMEDGKTEGEEDEETHLLPGEE